MSHERYCKLRRSRKKIGSVRWWLSASCQGQSSVFQTKWNDRSKWLNRACPMQCPCTASIVLRNYQMENILVSSRELKSCVSLVSVTQRCPGHRSAVNCLAVTVVRQLSTKCYNRRLGLTQTLLIRFDKTSRQNVPQDKWGPLPNMGDHWPPNLIFNNWINSEWGEIRREYSKNDVKKYLEVWLSWTGNPRYILSKNPRDSLWNGVSLQQKTILHFPGFFCWKLHWWGLHWTLSG